MLTPLILGEAPTNPAVLQVLSTSLLATTIFELAPNPSMLLVCKDISAHWRSDARIMAKLLFAFCGHASFNDGLDRVLHRYVDPEQPEGYVVQEDNILANKFEADVLMCLWRLTSHDKGAAAFKDLCRQSTRLRHSVTYFWEDDHTIITGLDMVSYLMGRSKLGDQSVNVRRALEKYGLVGVIL